MQKRFVSKCAKCLPKRRPITEVDIDELSDQEPTRVRVSANIASLVLPVATMSAGQKRLPPNNETSLSSSSDLAPTAKRQKPFAQTTKSVILAVGSHNFRTTFSTLRSCGGMLASMFSEEFLERGMTTPDTDGVYFIDRDPLLFEQVLRFLRSKDHSAFQKDLWPATRIEMQYFTAVDVREIDAALVLRELDGIDFWLKTMEEESSNTIKDVISDIKELVDKHGNDWTPDENPYTVSRGIGISRDKSGDWLFGMSISVYDIDIVQKPTLLRLSTILFSSTWKKEAVLFLFQHMISFEVIDAKPIFYKEFVKSFDLTVKIPKETIETKDN